MKNFLLFTAVMLLFCRVATAQCDPATYTEPQFSIAVQHPVCPVPSEIRVVSASGGVGPYSFTLLPGNLISATGIFQNVVPGNYQVRLTDACGTIRTRQATITAQAITTSSTLTSLGCKNFEFGISCSVTGPALEYGYALNGGAITWGQSNLLQMTVEPHTTVSLYVKDSCGNQAVSTQYINEEMGGYIKILNERIECFGQEIYPEYYGFDEPKVCLYKSPQNTLVECKQAPSGIFNGGVETNFFDLPFGQDYYVIVEDGCYRDSMFFKDKTSMGGSELNPFNWNCTTFDIHSDGNGYDSVCLYNATTNQLVSCKPYVTNTIDPRSGQPWPYGGAEWYNLPYGSYYSYIYDPCIDTLIRIDTTVVYPRNFSTQLHHHCAVFQTGVGSHFGPESPRPHRTTIFYPDGLLAGTFVDQGTYLEFPTYPLPGNLTVIQEDGCGHKDTSVLAQPMLLPTSRILFTGGCPGINGSSGGGNLTLYGDRVGYGGQGNGNGPATVQIIKQDGNPVNILPNHIQWNATAGEQVYQFTNLTTGTYILESTIGCYGMKVYDTAVVRPYVYPTQDQPHIYQCGSNAYVFRDTVTGGLAPYTYEILATVPSLFSLLTGPQSSNTFFIPPGTSLSTITMRVVDACGNSNIRVFPVNHLGFCDPLVGINPVQNIPLVNKPIKIYPNPSNKEFFIEISYRQKQDYRIEIFNSVAALVYSQLVSGVDRRTIPVRHPLTKGIYSVVITEVKSGKRSVHKQVVF